MKSRTNWKAAKADTLWGRIIHLRDGDRCYLCQSSPAEAHHLFAKSLTTHPTIRFNPDCGVLLCQPDHRYAEQSQEAFWGELVGRMNLLNPDRVDLLLELKSKALPIFDGHHDWPAILEYLNGELERVQQTAWMDHNHNLPERGQY